MKFSIALCTYNGEKFLQEQLNSYLNQTVKVDEIVICDDISTDGTWNILTNFKENCDIPIILKRNETQLGVMRNFEQALSLCSGDLILLSDQDDIWLENRVDYFLKYFEVNKSTQLLFSNAELLINGYDDNEIKARTLYELLDFNEKTQKAYKEGYALEVMQVLGRTSGFTMAIKKELIKEVLPFVSKYEYFIHDRQLALYAVEKQVIDFTQECLTKYRIHKNQTSNIYEYLLKNRLLPKRRDGLLKFLPISQDVIDYLRIKGFDNVKFNFSQLRNKNIKSVFGIFLIFKSLKSYKIIYKRYFLKAVIYDLKFFFRINLLRIKKLLNK